MFLWLFPKEPVVLSVIAAILTSIIDSMLSDGTVPVVGSENSTIVSGLAPLPGLEHSDRKDIVVYMVFLGYRQLGQISLHTGGSRWS